MFGRDVVLRFGGFFGVRKVDLRNTGMLLVVVVRQALIA